VRGSVTTQRASAFLGAATASSSDRLPARTAFVRDYRPRPGARRLCRDQCRRCASKLSPDQTHPYRQVELLPEVNKRLPAGLAVKPYDLHSVRRVHRIDHRTRPDFVYQPKWKGSSPQYSDEFVEWLAEQAEADPEFFENARAKFYAMPKPKAGQT
jgi:hypothetical protein